MLEDMGMAELKANMGVKARAIEIPRLTGVFYFLTALIFMGFSFWNGLYFDASFMVASIYWAIIVLFNFLWLKMNRLKVNGWNVADYLVFTFFVIYFLSSISPANVEYAVLGFVRGISYVSLYFVIRILISVDDRKYLFIDFLILSGVLFGIYGLANGFGSLNINGAIFDPQMRRLAANFEYANTYAIYQGIAFLFAVIMSCYVADQSKRKYLYEIAGFITLASMILTYSRGTWLTLASMLIFMLVISPKENKGKLTLNALIPIIVLVLCMSLLAKATLGQKQFLGWGTLLLGMAGVVLLTSFTNGLKRRLTPRQWKVGAFGFGAFIVMALVAVIAKHGLPQNFVQRLASINFHQFSVIQRFQFYRDGLKILSEHPILGAGPKAWEALWQHYQSYPYTSRQSHSFLIDIIMSIGIVGFLVFASILVSVFRLSIRAHRKQHARNRLITDGLLIALFGLLVHGSIDFDLSYGTINFLMWALIALLLPKLAVAQESLLARSVQTPAFQKSLTILDVTFSVIAVLIASGYLLSDHYLRKAVAFANNPEAGLSAAENAVALAPYRSSAWIAKAQFEERLFKKNKKDSLKKEISGSAENAALLAAHDPEVLSQAGQLVAVYGDVAQGIDLMKKAWENGRYHIQYPEQYITYTDSVGTQLYSKDKSKAKVYLQESLNTYHDVEQRIENFKNLPALLKPEYKYDLTPSMHLYAGESAFYLGQYDEAKRLIEPLLTMQSVNEQDKMKAQVILTVIQEKHGKPVDIELLNMFKKVEGVNQYYEQLQRIS
jgi:O-antigen ligase